MPRARACVLCSRKNEPLSPPMFARSVAGQIGRLSGKGSERPYQFCFPVSTSRGESAKQMAPNWVPLIGAQLQQAAGKARSAVG